MLQVQCQTWNVKILPRKNRKHQSRQQSRSIRGNGGRKLRLIGRRRDQIKFRLCDGTWLEYRLAKSRDERILGHNKNKLCELALIALLLVDKTKKKGRQKSNEPWKRISYSWIFNRIFKSCVFSFWLENHYSYSHWRSLRDLLYQCHWIRRRGREGDRVEDQRRQRE